MSRAKKLLENNAIQPLKRTRNLVQYNKSANSRRATTKTGATLEAGVYNLVSDMMGTSFEIHEIKTDELFRFKDSRYNQILDEVNKFWEVIPNFSKFGITAKRGILLYGEPGTGKSCLLKLMMEDMVGNGDVVFLTRSPRSLISALKEFREVEPDRKALVILEDMDTIIQHGEHVILELFDGDDQLGNIVYVGTTNYLDRLPPRILREGRFDRKVEIKPPPKEGRLAYFKHKLGVHEKESLIEEIADDTDGFTFGQLREFIVAIYCLGKNRKSVIERIKNGGGLDECKQYEPNVMEQLILKRFGYLPEHKVINVSRAKQLLEANEHVTS